MAKDTKTKTTRKKKNGNKKGYKKKTTLYRTLPPQYQLAKLKFNAVSTIQANPGLTINPIVLQMRPNDLYDSLVTIGGLQQSLYRDQMFGMYQHARCLGYKINCKFISLLTSPLEVILAPNVTNAIYSPPTIYSLNPEAMKQKKYSKFAITNIYKGSTNLQIYCTTDNYHGRAKGYTLKDDTALQSVNTGLSNVSYNAWDWAIRDLGGGIQSGTRLGFLEITITQYVRFETPAEVEPS